MKKNRMMRLASILLVCVLLTTSVISGTFAKYTTSDIATDTARVAKFGVTIEAEGSNAEYSMFEREYDSDSDFVGATVKATEKVVAPGTEGTLTKFEITGTPEVAVRIRYEVDTVNTKFENWDIAQEDGTTTWYMPLIIHVGSADVYVSRTIPGGGISTADQFIEWIQKALDEKSWVYPAGTDLSTTTQSDLTISWEWEFEGDTIPEIYKNDYNDTELGNWELNEKDAPTITLSIRCIVEQVD